jgi:hypothetical protein
VKTKYRYYGQCPFCNVIEGPYETVTGMTKDVQAMHSQCRPDLEVSTGRPLGTPVPPPAPVYMRGDHSRPFPSNFEGVCTHCGIGYFTGESICMVTFKDRSKGKPVHMECLEATLKIMDVIGDPDQSDEPPF